MYNDLHDFERLFCPLQEIKVIHLLRNAANVTRSSAHMWADYHHYKKQYRDRCHLQEQPLPHVPLTAAHLQDLTSLMIPPKLQNRNLTAQSPVEDWLKAYQAAVEALQQQHGRLLQKHPCKFVVNYDEITANTQVNKLPEKFCAGILDFLGLDYFPLTNNLRKTG